MATARKSASRVRAAAAKAAASDAVAALNANDTAAANLAGEAALGALKNAAAIMGLGGGRRRAEDDIDYSVGLGEIAAIGERSDTERPLCIVHAATEADAHRAAVEIRAAFTIGDEAPPKAPVVRRRVGPDKPLDQT